MPVFKIRYEILSSKTVNSLRVSDINNEDETEYTCTARGLSTSAKLSIKIPPEILDENYKKKIVTKIGSKESVVVPIKSYPEPEITSYLNDSEVEDIKRRKIAFTDGKFTFAINKCERHDTGIYKISLKNIYGEVIVEIDFSVLGKIKILKC